MKTFKRSVAITAVLAFVLLVLDFKYPLITASGNLYDEIQRFMEVIHAVKKAYVEEVDAKILVNGAIKGMLENLDPHTVYITKERMQEITEQFEGEFEGIGIEFIIHNKIPTVVSPIAESPSERLGLRPGDQITKIEGISTYGISEQGVRKKLLGSKGTKVTIQILRPGLEEPFDLTITRDVIPVYSITAAFMINDSTGIIKVGRFAKTTNDEFEKALQDLISQGMKRLVLDLRGNSGGYLEQAVEMADKFLEGDKRIVYTRGRIPNSNADYYSTSEAAYPDLPLIVLLDHGSASASEIVAGAIQDWDRGLIVGMTSFGKGLVQQQVFLKDGAAVRVTIARYYTPSGRLIQRSYKNGLYDYMAEGWDDTDPNAIADSTRNKPVFTTNSGRKVFGGGGISPDIAIKSNILTITTVKLIQNQVFFEFGSNYATDHRKLSANFRSFKDNFEINEQILNDFLNLAKSKEIAINEQHIKQDLAFIKRRIKSQIARHLWSAREFYQIELLGGAQLQAALKYFPQAAEMVRLNSEGE